MCNQWFPTRVVFENPLRIESLGEYDLTEFSNIARNVISYLFQLSCGYLFWFYGNQLKTSRSLPVFINFCTVLTGSHSKPSFFSNLIIPKQNHNKVVVSRQVSHLETFPKSVNSQIEKHLPGLFFSSQFLPYPMESFPQVNTKTCQHLKNSHKPKQMSYSTATKQTAVKPGTNLGKNELFDWIHLLRFKRLSSFQSSFEVFFGACPSASSRHLAFFSQQKTGPGVEPTPSGEIQTVARRRGGGYKGIPYKVADSFSFCSSWILGNTATASDDALLPLSEQDNDLDKHII